MKLHRAWILQAASDLTTASMLEAAGSDRCQVVAKCQQTAEKSMKALVEALGLAIGLRIRVGKDHRVLGFAKHIRETATPAIPKRLGWLKDELERAFPAHVIEAIESLDLVVPKYPASGQLASRNSEYPFQPVTASDWFPPCHHGVFGKGDQKRWFFAVDRLHGDVSKILSSLELAHLI